MNRRSDGLHASPLGQAASKLRAGASEGGDNGCQRATIPGRLEASGIAQAIRQSVWLYPMANVLHVVAVVSFTGAVVVMDFALLGWLGDSNLVLARRAASVVIVMFALVAVTGLMLFIAEASHVAMNRVFQLKLVFIAAGADQCVAPRAPRARR